MIHLIAPRLGCPEIVAPADLCAAGFPLIVAAPAEQHADWSACRLSATPSYKDQGRLFELALGTAELLADDTLPRVFNEVAATRRLLSTVLRTRVLPGYQFWYFLAHSQKDFDTNLLLRKVCQQSRSTLYDLVLRREGETLDCATHSLCVREANARVRFVHLTDLHVAARNDVWEAEIASLGYDLAGKEYSNFNERLRRFITWANQKADEGELDFVLALGDLVDFAQLGFVNRAPGDNNWTTLIEIFTGSAKEEMRGNLGLRVPLFTIVGNHDWRVYPYPPEAMPEVFSISKKAAGEFDYLYHDTTEEVGQKLTEMHDRLIAKGSPILARTWWGGMVSFGVRWLTLGTSRLWIRAKAILVRYLRYLLSIAIAGGASGYIGLNENKLSWGWIAAIGVLAVLALVGTFVVSSWLDEWLRKNLERLISIETTVETMADYFLKINPYFNLAFLLERCYFLLLDTGHDTLIAQSFWDDGGKKLSRVTLRDNVIGRAPDTMGFYPSNEYYPYSQITWLERVLARISAEHSQQAQAPRRCRIFVGLHAPAANLSKADRGRADRLVQQGDVLMKRGSRLLGGFNIRWGTVNHYLSEFFYLCLGYREGETQEMSGPGVDAVFSGHAHWGIEFKLRKPNPADADWKPEVLYGRFSPQVEMNGNPGQWWGPLLLQTAACGPPSPTDPDCPNFRYVVVDGDLRVSSLAPRTLPGGPFSPSSTS